MSLDHSPNAQTGVAAGDRALFQFETHPEKYHHWKLTFGDAASGSGDVATLTMSVKEEFPIRPGYVLKLNSYDLGVDIELADAVQRIRFEHPHIKTVVITSDRDRVFCAGANIFMLASSGHPFKVNFCKFTNETRLGIEDASQHSGQKYLAACNGSTAGGGYELALACDEIILIDDGSSTVSLPEVPLLGVLPGTGGLTRLVDKRKVRRDLADVFVTLAEGIKGKRAVEWRLIDQSVPRSKFSAAIGARARALADTVKSRAPGAAIESPAAAAGNGQATQSPHFDKPAAGGGIALEALDPKDTVDKNGRRELRYHYVDLSVDPVRRIAELTIKAPATASAPDSPAAMLKAARDHAYWPLRAFRELDDALLQLRFNHETVGLVLLKTRGDLNTVLAEDRALWKLRDSWLGRETLLNMGRVLRRLDLTAKTFFAVVDPESCFAGSLLELALAADRIYLLDDPDREVHMASSPLQAGVLPMSQGLSRLQTRFLGTPEHVAKITNHDALIDGPTANELGLCTVAADSIDFDDELRVAIEERLSLSPDALTGAEASLRFAGPETGDSKIFARLSAWQNWIFIRPNATGEKGALSLYGKPQRPEFDWRRT